MFAGSAPFLPARESMGYLEKNLIPGETVLFRTRLHSIVLIGPIFTALLICVPGTLCAMQAQRQKGEPGNGAKLWALAAALSFIIAFVVILYGIAKRNSTEMAVTNRRVLIKWGLGSRRTLEIVLAKVESISVSETVLGRMLGYGTVIVRGTGGTPEPVVLIARPNEFRRSVYEQLALMQGPAAGAAS
jgi:uncharacterized membrane protein YdbT with pleckstrin-like domain